MHRFALDRILYDNATSQGWLMFFLDTTHSPESRTLFFLMRQNQLRVQISTGRHGRLISTRINKRSIYIYIFG